MFACGAEESISTREQYMSPALVTGFQNLINWDRLGLNAEIYLRVF